MTDSNLINDAENIVQNVSEIAATPANIPSDINEVNTIITDVKNISTIDNIENKIKSFLSNAKKYILQYINAFKF